MIQLVKEKLDVAEDDRQEIIEIVSHTAGHLPHCPQFLGLDDLILGLFQLFKSLFQIGEELGVLNRDAHLAGKGG